MVCLGFEPRAAGWKAQTNPLSYGGTPTITHPYTEGDEQLDRPNCQANMELCHACVV